MAGEKNFIIKNGLTVGTTEVIDSSGSITAAAVGSALNESIADKIGGIIQGSGSTTVTYDDANDTITISSTGKTEEEIQDIVGAQLVTNGSHTGLSASYDDAGDGAIDITVSLAGFSTSDLSEGSNQYHTTERVQDVVGAQLVTNGSHTNITASYDDAGDGAVDLSITDAAIRGKISVTDSGGDGSLAYDNGTGVITYTGPSASEVQAHITAGTGVSISSGAVSIGQSVGTSDKPSFAGITLTADSDVTGHIIPSADNTYDLGSSSKTWRDVYVGPGSLYVNGQQVVSDSSGTIVVSADANQNVSVQTSGSGDVELDPTGSGSIQLKGPISVQAGSNVASSDGNAISFSNSIDVDAIESRSADTNLVLSANGTGVVAVSDSLTVSGDLTVSGTTTTVNSETINLADNVIALNSNFTSGSPTEDSGISITRGGSSAKTLLWDETNDKWTVGSETFVAGTFEGALTGNVTGTVSSLSNHDTDDVSEGSSNLYYTDTRARAAITVTDAGGDGSLAYSGGTITYTGPSASETRAHFSGGTGVSISSGTIAIGQAVATSSDVEFNEITTNYASNSGGVARNVYQSTSAPTSSDGAVGDLWILYS